MREPKIKYVPWLPGEFLGSALIPGVVLLHEDVEGTRHEPILIAHEKRHHAQQKRDGYLRWLWRYLTSRRWRAFYEAEAYAQHIKIFLDGRSRVWRAFHLRRLSEYFTALIGNRYSWYGFGEMPAFEEIQAEIEAYV